MQAPGEFQTPAIGYQMLGMSTVSEIRHRNLLLLIAREGSIQALASKIERSHSQISQLKNLSKRADGRPRVIGDDLARHIEDKLDLSPGWMDHPQAGAYAGGSAVWAKTAQDGQEMDRRTIGEFAADAAATSALSRLTDRQARRVDDLRRLVEIIAADPELTAEAVGYLTALSSRARLGGEITPKASNGH